VLRSASLLLALAVVAPAAQAASLDLAAESRIGRCILEHLDGIHGRDAVAALVRACELSVLGAAPEREPAEAVDDSFLVRCRVASDPEWVEYRLISRRQCRAVNGVHLPSR